MFKKLTEKITIQSKKIAAAAAEHRLILILALIMTVLIFAPLIAFPFVAGNKYAGININHFGNDADFYLSRGNEVLKGNGLGSPLLREGKNGVDVYFSYSDYLLLAPIKLLGLANTFNIVQIYNFYDFIGVFVLILLIYSLVLKLSGDKLLSATAAIFVIGGYSIIFTKTLFYDNLNFYARAIYPFFSSLVLFAYLNLFLNSLKTDKLKSKIAAGIFFGLLFYVYFYAWTFALALNACLLIVYLFKKDFSKVKIAALVSLIGLTLGAYYLYGLLSFMLSEAGKQMSYFMSMSFSHAPILSKIGLAALLICGIFWYKRRSDSQAPFILALILSGWLALNQQIITGRMLQYGHYYWYFITPLCLIAIFYMLGRLLSGKLKTYFLIFALSLTFLNTAGGQYRSFYNWYEIKLYEQNFRPLLDTLNRDKRPAVILAPEENGFLFTIYTPHDLFWHGAATLSYLPIQRIKDALFVYVFLNKQSRNDFKNYLTKTGDNEAGRVFYQGLYRNLAGYYKYADGSADDDKILSQLDGEYKETVKNGGVAKLLAKYGVNYVVWDKNLNPEWDLSVLGGKMKEIVSSDNIYLYQISYN